MTALNDFPLHNKILLITGGGSGICLAFATLALRASARCIIIADLALSAGGQALVDEAPNRVLFKRTDVTHWQDLEALFSFSVAKLGDVPDIVVPGAGIFEPAHASFWGNTEEASFSTMDINASHVFRLTRLAMRALMGRGKQGVVCSIASIAGLFGAYGSPLYSASKFAVIGFTRSMGPAERLEGVKVVALCPGLVDTPLWEGRQVLFGIAEKTGARVLKPKEVADAMMKVITSGEYRGGDVIEVMDPEVLTCIPVWNVQPSEQTAALSSMQHGGPELDPLFEPIKDVTNKERERPWL